MTKFLPRQRVPEGCLPGFPSRYTVVRGDTMFKIAQRFGVSLDALIKNNEHITNPDLIFPGDVLCVPTLLISPCCIILRPQRPMLPGITPDTSGVALIRSLTTKDQDSVSILAVDMPPPSELGNFDTYDGFLSIPNIGGFGFGLFPTPTDPPIWAGTIEINRLLTPDTRILVIPVNSQTGVSGETPVLKGIIEPCTQQP